MPDARPDRPSSSRRPSPTQAPGARSRDRRDKSAAHPLIPQPDHPIAFLRGFLERPKEVGSIIPSSRWMERRITRTAELATAKLAIELGPGTGGTTKALLQAMAPDATLLAIEINPGFCDLIRETIDDPRLIVHEGSAADIADALAKHDLGAPDVVLSGIPFSTMPRELGLAILRSVKESLAPGGRFVAYQFRDVVHTLGKQVFGAADVQLELLNVPPMRVYRWDMPTGSR
ncbi:MAG TPA: methyltransferase domain-containing protein [Myxococcota bacterium]|nr:methyltransferase domain-containing protein [Myxococcales bacterium]HPG24774.1 methyltransferase domain-containing protein [Myxococcota bacterium]